MAHPKPGPHPVGPGFVLCEGGRVTVTLCEFRHLLVASQWEGRRYLGHVHEDEALACAYYERLGWPRKGGIA